MPTRLAVLRVNQNNNKHIRKDLGVSTKTRKNNMTAKDKAKELVDRFNEHIEYDTNFKDETSKAKKRALICVNEMLEMSYSGYQYDSEIEVPFLEEVKKEIKKL